MDIDEYIWRNRLTGIQFGKDAGINPVTLCKMRNFKCIPSMTTALKVVKHTKGKVSLLEMIPPEDRSQYEFENENETTN